MAEKRIVVSGMSVNTPIGDDLDTFYRNLLAGRSAITRWRFVKEKRVYSKVGGDLSGYDYQAKFSKLAQQLPEEVHARCRKILRAAPFSTKLSVLSALDAWLNAGLDFDFDPRAVAVLVGGHN
ncbi:MAG TPA: beta-ketoacyl synthase N-terminal-like domain-containing protein, partial [Candidatus Manganitrophaceae bacterium]